ncbi:MAG: hypothetical protein WEC84_01765 [Candidatus Andersenbacteria bacterium]
MGILDFFTNIHRKEGPEIEVRITSSPRERANKKKIVFSDNDPDLIEYINSTERINPTKKLPFSANCPYCGVVSDRLFKRKRACPECGKAVHVRTTQDLYPSSALTDEQVNHVEFYFAMKDIIYVTMDDYRATEEALKKKWNKEKINTYDVLWSLHNNLNIYRRHIDKAYDQKQIMVEILRRRRWMDQSAARYQANRGHDPDLYLKSAHNNDIQIAKMDENVKGITVKCYDCCESCMKFNDKTFSIEFVEKTPVLPTKTCTRPFNDDSEFTFCNCSYQNYYEWE